MYQKRLRDFKKKKGGGGGEIPTFDLVLNKDTANKRKEQEGGSKSRSVKKQPRW